MQGEDAIGWDPTLVPPRPSIASSIYLLFLFLTVIATIVRLVTIRKALLPPRARANPAVYLKQLQPFQSTLKQWIGCALLGWGIIATNGIYQASSHLLYAKAVGTATLFSAIAGFTPFLVIGLYVVLFLFLVRWYVLSRIQYITNDRCDYGPSY
jgi:hypothetical protein